MTENLNKHFYYSLTNLFKNISSKTAVKNRLIEGINNGYQRNWKILKGASIPRKLANMPIINSKAPAITTNKFRTKNLSHHFLMRLSSEDT